MIKGQEKSPTMVKVQHPFPVRPAGIQMSTMAWHLSIALWLPCPVEEGRQVLQPATTSRHQHHPNMGISNLIPNTAQQSTQRMVMIPCLTLSILSARKLKHRRHSLSQDLLGVLQSYLSTILAQCCLHHLHHQWLVLLPSSDLQGS